MATTTNRAVTYCTCRVLLHTCGDDRYILTDLLCIHPFIYTYGTCRVGKNRSQDSKDMMAFEDDYDPDF